MKKEDIKELKEVGFYEFVSRNYRKMEREELKELLQEFIYATSKEVLKSEYDMVQKKAIRQLEENSEKE